MEVYRTLSAEQRFEITRVVDRRLKELGISGLRDALQEQTKHFGRALTKLTEAQARTDATLEKLTQAQARTDATLEKLTQAQARTDATLEKLTQAQARTDARMDRVEATLEKLVQAQARTDARMDRVEATLEKLVQAQARTDATLEKLTQAQARTDARMDRVEANLEKLTQAQARTEIALQELAEAQARTEVALKHQQRHLSGLGEVIGFGLEDIAKTVVPGYLQRHFGIDLEGPLGDELARRFFQVNGQPVEIDLYGEGSRDGRRVVVLAESKSRIGGTEVHRFARKIASVEPLLEGEIWRIMFGYYIHPSAQKPAEEHRIRLIASYQR